MRKCFFCFFILCVILCSCQDEPVNDDIAKETYTELTLEDFNSISLGMPRKEIISIIGQEHDYSGNGIIAQVYYLKDGSSVFLYYAHGNLNAMMIRDQVGRFFILDSSYE